MIVMMIIIIIIKKDSTEPMGRICRQFQGTVDRLVLCPNLAKTEHIQKSTQQSCSISPLEV